MTTTATARIGTDFKPIPFSPTAAAQTTADRVTAVVNGTGDFTATQLPTYDGGISLFLAENNMSELVTFGISGGGVVIGHQAGTLDATGHIGDLFDARSTFLWEEIQKAGIHVSSFSD